MKKIPKVKVDPDLVLRFEISKRLAEFVDKRKDINLNVDEVADVARKKPEAFEILKLWDAADTEEKEMLLGAIKETLPERDNYGRIKKEKED